MTAPATTPLGWRPAFIADWTRFLFVHYSLPASDLAPLTPLALDVREGRAFVSLVCFRFERMRPAALLPAPVGRVLFRPASDHWFLNLRTYVRGPAGPGIQFLIEWMDNPLSRHLGPWLYGLPYVRGLFNCTADDETGRCHRCITDAATGDALQISYGTAVGKDRHPELGSLDEFLVEKYTAYTHHRGRTRFFRIAHPAWKVARPAQLEVDDTLIRRRCPWFARAEFIGAHVASGFRDIAMGFPHTVPTENPAAELCHASN